MKYLLTLFSICSIGLAAAQNVNWASLEEDQKHIVSLNFGYDYGMTTQVGFGKKLTWFKPILLTADASVPMGNEAMDDCKIRIGGQIPVLSHKDYLLTAKINGVFRSHKTSLVSMKSFGSETGLIFGTYKPTWSLAAEVGYDNSGAIYLQHSEQMQETYPSIKDGWYAAAGGNFFYGIQATKAIGKKLDTSVRLGATNARGADEDAFIPIYFQLGVNYRF